MPPFLPPVVEVRHKAMAGGGTPKPPVGGPPKFHVSTERYPEHDHVCTSHEALRGNDHIMNVISSGGEDGVHHSVSFWEQHPRHGMVCTKLQIYPSGHTSVGDLDGSSRSVTPASPELKSLIHSHHDNHAWMPLLDKIQEEYEGQPIAEAAARHAAFRHYGERAKGMTLAEARGLLAREKGSDGPPKPPEFKVNTNDVGGDLWTVHNAGAACPHQMAVKSGDAHTVMFHDRSGDDHTAFNTDLVVERGGRTTIRHRGEEHQVPPASPQLRSLIAAHHKTHAWMPLLDKIQEEYEGTPIADAAQRHGDYRQGFRREKAMCLSDDEAGGVFRGEKAAGLSGSLSSALLPMPVSATVFQTVGTGPQVPTVPPTAEAVVANALPAGVYEYRCPHCDGKAYNGDPETGIQFRGGGHCHDCGSRFSIAGMKLSPVSSVPLATPTPCPVPARDPAGGQVREKGHNKDSDTAEMTADATHADHSSVDDGQDELADDNLHNHPVARGIAAEAMRLMGAREPDYGHAGNAIKAFVEEVVSHPDAKAVIRHLLNDHQARAAVIEQLNGHVRQKAMTGEGESLPPPEPVKPVKAPKGKTAKGVGDGAAKPPMPKKVKADAPPPAEPTAVAHQPDATPVTPPAGDPPPSPASAERRTGEHPAADQPKPDIIHTMRSAQDVYHRAKAEGGVTNDHFQEVLGLLDQHPAEELAAFRPLGQVPERYSHDSTKRHMARTILRMPHRQSPAKSEGANHPNPHPDPHPDATREYTPPPAEEPHHQPAEPQPAPRDYPAGTPVKIPGVERFDDGGEGEGDTPDTRTFPADHSPEGVSRALGRSAGGQTSPSGVFSPIPLTPLDTPADQPSRSVPARDTADGRADDAPPTGGDTQKAPAGSHRFFLGNGQYLDSPAAPGTDFKKLTQQLQTTFGHPVTHAVDEHGARVWPAESGGKAGGGRRGGASADNPHGHTKEEQALAQRLRERGLGELGRKLYGGKHYEFTTPTGDGMRLSKDHLVDMDAGGGLPTTDQQAWPRWVIDSHKKLQGIGASVVDWMPSGRKMKVQGSDGAEYMMGTEDLTNSLAAGKLVPPAGHRQAAELDKLAGEFERRGFGKLVGHLKTLNLYHFEKPDGSPMHLRPWDVQEALRSGRLPGDPVIPNNSSTAAVRTILKRHPHLGELKTVLPAGEKGGDPRYHVTAADGTHHFPTLQDLMHAHAHGGVLPDSHGFAEAGLGEVLDRNKDGTLHVHDQKNGGYRVLTTAELNDAVRRARGGEDNPLPPLDRPSDRADDGPTATELKRESMRRYASENGYDEVEANIRQEENLKLFQKYVQKYGDTADTFYRFQAAMGRAAKPGLGTGMGRLHAELGRAFADHPANTGRRPKTEKEVREALETNSLGKLGRRNDNGTFLVYGKDNRARVMTLPEIHDALDAGELPPARDIRPTTPHTVIPIVKGRVPVVKPIPTAQPVPVAERLKPGAERAVKAAAGRMVIPPTHQPAVEAINRNARAMRLLAAMNAHRVAHRFNGDLAKAEAALYKVIRNLAYHVHKQGVGAQGERDAYGLKARVRRLKGMGFDPSAFSDGRNPSAALAGLFAS